jgi:hypothetical protein
VPHGTGLNAPSFETGWSIRTGTPLGQPRNAGIRLLLHQNRRTAFCANAFNFSSSPPVSRIESFTVVSPFLMKTFT